MRILLLSLLLAAAFTTKAQSSLWDGGKEKMMQTKEKGKSQAGKLKQWKNHVQQWGLDSNYNYALSISARLNTNGWSGDLNYIHQKVPGIKVLWSLHFSEIKHEKETKQQQSKGFHSELGRNTPFSFGKINNAYTLQLGYGREQMLLPALLDGNMSISLRYSAGPSLAMLKPVYLNLVYTEYVPEERSWVSSERYSTANREKFLLQHTILGGDKWSKGLGELKFIPGLFADLAFVIEPDKPKSFVKAITIGGNLAYYTSPIEIMAERKAYRHQASFFVGLGLGKRWK